MSGPAYAAIAAGSLLGASGHMKSGDAARKVAEYNAAIQERNAKVFGQQADMRLDAQDRENIKFEKQAERFLDSVGVAYRKNKVVANTGTPLKVQLASAAELDEEIAYKTYNAKVEAQALREQGTNMQLSATLPRMEGRAKQSASRIAAFQSLLGGGEKAAFIYAMA